MKIRKMITKISAVIMAVVVIATAVPAYAYVEDTKRFPGYGIVKGWQDDLYEQDYNQICWVTMHTTLSEWSSGIRTAIDYLPVDTATGDPLNDQKGVRSYSSSCSADCYISNYGYYEDIGDVSLFSAHWADGNGAKSEIAYVKDVY